MARAGRWDVPTRSLLQTPAALPPGPACGKQRHALVSAGAGLLGPGARSMQFQVMRRVSAGCGYPIWRGFQAGDRLLVWRHLADCRRIKLPTAMGPVFLFLSLVELP